MTQDIDAGFTCDKCGSYCKRYTRSFNANMAMALICLYRYSKGKFVKVEDLLLSKGYKRCGDFSYCRFYGLIERKEGTREDGSERNGYYRLTGRGVTFVEGKMKVQKNFLIFHNSCDGFKGEEISIEQALGKTFDYNELMGYSMKLTPPTPQADSSIRYSEQRLFT